VAQAGSRSSRCWTAGGDAAETLVMSDLAGYVMFVAIAVVGLATVAIGTVRAWIWLDGRRLPIAASVTVTILFAAVTFLGLWLLLDLYWMVRGVLRAIHRAQFRPTEPST
jgi:hypothetical protein